MAVRLLAACSLGGAGHLRPLLPFLDAAAARGDDRLVVGPAGLAGMVAGTGHPFRAGGQPPEEEVAPIREQLPVAPPAEASALGNRELFGRMATAAMLPAMARAYDEHPPQLVVREPCEYASAVLSADRGVPTVQVAISLAEAEAGAVDVAEPALEAHRRGLADAVRATPYLTRFPASIDPSPFPDTVRYHEPPPVGRPLPDWWDGSAAPLVYVSFGTVLGHMSMAADVYRTAVGAIGRLPARVLLTTGPAVDPALLGPLPAHVHAERWVDQADVLDPADLVVCHGGSGTVLGALAAGVPVVAAPLFADQFENARRVADAGAGLVVELGGAGPDGRRVPLRPGASSRMAGAVEAALGNPGLGARARQVASELAATPGPAALLARYGETVARREAAG